MAKYLSFETSKISSPTTDELLEQLPKTLNLETFNIEANGIVIPYDLCIKCREYEDFTVVYMSRSGIKSYECTNESLSEALAQMLLLLKKDCII